MARRRHRRDRRPDRSRRPRLGRDPHRAGRDRVRRPTAELGGGRGEHPPRASTSGTTSRRLADTRTTARRRWRRCARYPSTRGCPFWSRWVCPKPTCPRDVGSGRRDDGRLHPRPVPVGRARTRRTTGAPPSARRRLPGWCSSRPKTRSATSSSSNDMANRLGARTERLDGLGHWWALQDPHVPPRCSAKFWATV